MTIDNQLSLGFLLLKKNKQLSFELCSFSTYLFKIISSELPVYTPLNIVLFPVQCVLFRGHRETILIRTMHILLFS